MSPDALRGRVAVVTGASSGIGAAVARSLAREGASVALAARREDALLETQATLGEAGSGERSIVVPADVTDREAVKALVARTESEIGPVEILVNCAGVMYYTVVSGDWVVTARCDSCGRYGNPREFSGVALGGRKGAYSGTCQVCAGGG